jgi:glycosyltransferase involved in cell wall biosynthesis
MVTPYPPARDGIAAYAVQEVARLRAEGHDVEVLSPGPSAAHHHLSLVGPRGALALAKQVRRYDRVVIQFHPDFFFPVPASPRDWALESIALAVPFCWAREVEVRIHEIDYSRGAAGRFRPFNRLPWKLATRVVVHTETERQSFSEAFGVAMERIELGRHGAHFRRATKMSSAEARASLALPPDALVLLNIGFIQPHKGFDRAVQAVADLSAGGLGGGYRLDVVGSVRTSEGAHLAYMDELRAAVTATPNAYLHEGYLSDELFDRWLVASDVVVLPYRSIWSSGVLERALLYDRQVIATDVGGLSFQRGDRSGVTLVGDDVGLRRAMADAIIARTGGTLTGEAVAPASWPSGEPVSRQAIQSEIRTRAAKSRPAAPHPVVGRPDDDHRGPTDASASVRGVRPAVLPPPASARPGGALVKKLVQRLTAWQIEPLVQQLNALREATIKALER